ncbi:MAG: glycosyltransferase family 2 protein [Bdellovibrio sp.]|nr:glycosyltransferase family 2 protein [Bdellovibrio sp.]
MDYKPPVSAVILTKNEEKHIQRCLNSLTWADEILVIDAFSQDKTVEICNDSTRPWAQNIKVIQKQWNGFKEQRNFSIKTAKNNWILVVDADEECSWDLAKKIKSFFKDSKEPPHRAYKVHRIEYFLEKPIHYGIWNPSYQDRFFYRDGVNYVNDVHEYPIFSVTPSRIHEPLKHAENFDVDKFINKMHTYTSIEAMDRFSKGQRTNWFTLLFAFPAMFFKNYFYYKAYKDGMRGFIISLLEGVSRVVRHIKIWKLTEQNLPKEKIK